MPSPSGVISGKTVRFIAFRMTEDDNRALEQVAKAIGARYLAQAMRYCIEVGLREVGRGNVTPPDLGNLVDVDEPPGP